MPRRRPGANTDANNKAFTFRLDRRREDEGRARELIEGWLAEERNKSPEERRELRDFVTWLVLRYSGETALISTSKSNRNEIQDIKAMLRDVLNEIRNRNPQGLMNFANQSSENAPLDDDFIDSLLEGWDK